MRIRILKPNLTVLARVREVGEIVNDPSLAECHNLILDGRAQALTDEENAAEEAKEEGIAAAQPAPVEQPADTLPA